MNKPLAYILAALLGGVTLGVSAQDVTDKPMPTAKPMPMPHGEGPHGGPRHDMRSMDTDHDGTVSKDEWMKAHEAMWDKMKKDPSGNVPVAPAGLPSDKKTMPK